MYIFFKTSNNKYIGGNFIEKANNIYFYAIIFIWV